MLPKDNMLQLRYQDYAYVVLFTKGEGEDEEFQRSEVFHHETSNFYPLVQAEEYAADLALDIQNSNVRVCRTRNRKRDGEIVSPGR